MSDMIPLAPDDQLYGLKEGYDVELRSKAPHLSYSIVLIHPEDAPPTELIERLNELGWLPSKYPGVRPLNGVQETALGKKGSGLFGTWSEREQGPNKIQANKVLRRFGFKSPRRVRLTIQDLL